MIKTAPETNEIILVIGASSKIAQAIIGQVSQRDGTHVIAVSRSGEAAITAANVTWLPCDYSEQGIAEVCQRLASVVQKLTRVVICNGMLHSDTTFPEKQLREFDREKWLESMETNALIPMLWVQAMAQILGAHQRIQIVVFSARVGSITDNRLGGWYSYRASKAALNMLIKTASIEMKRTHPNVSLLLFHPGTTDTPMSKPFQQRVPKGKLFSADFVARQLLDLLDRRTEPMPLEFLDWAGETIEF